MILSPSRRSGFSGPGGLPVSEILAYGAAVGYDVHAFLRIIRQVDNHYVAAMAEKIKRERKRS